MTWKMWWAAVVFGLSVTILVVCIREIVRCTNIARGLPPFGKIAIARVRANLFFIVSVILLLGGFIAVCVIRP
jgi:hypothetical protein